MIVAGVSSLVLTLVVSSRPAEVGHVAAPAAVSGVTLTLTRVSTLTNVNDTEGRWQFDGGTVSLNNTPIGYYNQRKRISFGVMGNESSTTYTLFLTGLGTPSESITLEGTHSFNSGSQIGGVSAASPMLSPLLTPTASFNTTPFGPGVTLMSICF
jgi:hypothetical protein